MRHRNLLFPILLSVMAVPSASLAGDAAQCTNAANQYNSAIQDMYTAMKRYTECVASSQGRDDCSTEFRAMRRPQSDYEDAVVAYRTGCTPDPAVPPLPQSQNGTTVYSPSQCIGAIVNGECHGTIMPDSQYHPTCHGEMINGQCTGPMF